VAALGTLLGTLIGCGNDYEPMPVAEAQKKTSEPGLWETEMVEQWTLDGKYKMTKGVPYIIRLIAEHNAEKRDRNVNDTTPTQWRNLCTEVADAMDEDQDNTISNKEAYDYSNDYFDWVNAEGKQSE